MDGVREAANGADISRVVQLSLELAQVLGVTVEPCPASIGAKAAELMCSEYGFVALSSGGFIVGEIVHSYFDGRHHAQELGWYAPGGGGVALLAAFEVWAERMGCSALRLSTRPDPGRIGALLKRRGYVATEMAWGR